MKILLDTHAFLWLMVDDPRLSVTAREVFLDPDNDILLSLASVWEMAIKANLRKLKLPQPVMEYVHRRSGRFKIHLLSITMEHLSLIETLPQHHRDPFDRLIIAQGQFENIPILTQDQKFDKYSIQNIW